MGKQIIKITTPLQHPSQSWASEPGINEVEVYLQHFLKAKISEAKTLGLSYKDLLTEIDTLIRRGGKRIRPKLVLTAYESYGGRNRAAITRVAASQELFHSFILMHDDIIDRDTVRWGGPNISGVYFDKFKEKISEEEARHYADSWALLAGDLCFNLSFEALLDSGFSAAKLMKAVKMVQQTLFTMVGGELADVALPMQQPPASLVDEEQLLKLNEIKTAVYSFSTPLRLGALLAGAGAAQDKRLNEFGKHIGIAFQIRDDILDIFGDETILGKSTLSDIREGKRTLLMNNGFLLANTTQLKKLKLIIGNHEASHEDLKTVRSILVSSGALVRTEMTMQNQCQEAHRILLKANFPLALSDFLADLLSFCTERAY